jgi:hypothetical protein
MFSIVSFVLVLFDSNHFGQSPRQRYMREVWPAVTVKLHLAQSRAGKQAKNAHL